MDIILYYQEKGNKEPFILLHGNGQNGSCFENQIDYFSNRYRVIALDTRGHGRSPRGVKLTMGRTCKKILANTWGILPCK